MSIQINGTTGISGVDGTAGSPALQGADTNTGISFGTDEVAINTGGTERVKVDSSGRVGIGITPSQLLHLSSTGFPTLRVTDADNSTYFDITNSDGDIILKADEGNTFANSAIRFNIDSSERMRIDSAGIINLGGGTTSDNNNAIFFPNVDSGGYFEVRKTVSSVSGSRFISFKRNGTQVGSITLSGTSNTAFNTSSDYRLKENVSGIADGISRLKQLQPCRFNFIEDPLKTVDGFIAHEVQPIIPEAITGEKDAVDDEGNPIYQGIDQSKLVPLLTAALQEAITKIETLEAKVAALEGGAV